MFDAEWLTFGNYTFSLRSLAFFYLDRLLEFTPSTMSVNLVQDDMQICEVVFLDILMLLPIYSTFLKKRTLRHYLFNQQISWPQ